MENRTSFRSITATIGAGILIQCSYAYADKASKVQLGLGSYTTAVPDNLSVYPDGEPQGAPPAIIYKTDKVSGAMPSSDWWTSIAWTTYSHELFAHPLSFKAVAAGLEVSNPVKTPRRSADGEHELAYLHDADFVVTGLEFNSPDARVDGFGDWSVDIMQSDGNKSLKSIIAHGSPYAFFEAQGMPIQFQMEKPYRILEGDDRSNYLVLQAGDNFYGIFGYGNQVQWQIDSKHITLIKDGDNLSGSHLTVALLPDSAQTTVQTYRHYAKNIISGTHASYAYDEQTNTVQTTYRFDLLQLHAGENKSDRQATALQTITALYPHQWRFVQEPLHEHVYDSVRGPLKTLIGKSFTTRQPVANLLPSLPDFGTHNRTLLRDLVKEELENNNQINDGPNPGKQDDPYWVGKNLQRLGELVVIADQLAYDEAKHAFLATMKKTMETHFTFNEGDNNKIFYYDNNWGALIGFQSNFEADINLNDHHFHYGYWVKAAAIIAMYDSDREWNKQEKWGGMVELLIRDYANWDREDTRFPYLRNFDIYAGHSWADGRGFSNETGKPEFGVGNNQESSSEAANAYAAVALWGAVTGNKQIKEVGMYLYTQETEAINNYWFPQTYGDLIDPLDYPYSQACKISGGQIDHSAWWTEELVFVRGINMLPLGGHSLYLAKNISALNSNVADIWQHYELRNSTPPEWTDILLMYEAMGNADSARKRWNLDTPSEFAESRAHTYQWLGALSALGTPDFNYTANTAFSAAFNNKGEQTWVAFNPSASEITVNFRKLDADNTAYSRETQVNVPARSFAVANEKGEPLVNPFEELDPRDVQENENFFANCFLQNTGENWWVDTLPWLNTYPDIRDLDEGRERRLELSLN